jgi:hypothetical protein
MLYSEIANSHIYISFLRVYWFEANLVAVLSSIIEDFGEKGNKIEIIEYHNFFMKNDILIRNGFADKFNLERSFFKGGNSPTHVPFRIYNSDDTDEHKKYVKNEIINSPHFPEDLVNLSAEITTNIYEIFVNAQTHGNCKNIHVCGQFFPKNEILNITIVDSGTTIKKNVQEFLENKNMSACECIDWTTIHKNTTKKKDGKIPGGIGLSQLLNHLSNNDGMLQIISSNGMWQQDKKNSIPKKLDMKTEFNGTIVNIKFNLVQKYESWPLDLEPLF